MYIYLSIKPLTCIAILEKNFSITILQAIAIRHNHHHRRTLSTNHPIHQPSRAPITMSTKSVNPPTSPSRRRLVQQPCTWYPKSLARHLSSLNVFLLCRSKKNWRFFSKSLLPFIVQLIWSFFLRDLSC